jgi:hypothetical protein
MPNTTPNYGTVVPQQRQPGVAESSEIVLKEIEGLMSAIGNLQDALGPILLPEGQALATPKEEQPPKSLVGRNLLMAQELILRARRWIDEIKVRLDN